MPDPIEMGLIQDPLAFLNQGGVNPNPVPTQAPPVSTNQNIAAQQLAAVDREAVAANARRPQPPPGLTAPNTAPLGAPGASVLEGMMTADGNTALANMLTRGRQQEGLMNQEFYNRQEDRRRNLMDMYKLELTMQSPLDRTLQTISTIEDPVMRYNVSVAEGLVKPRPILTNSVDSIGAYESWLADHPQLVTRNDFVRLAQAKQAAGLNAINTKVIDEGNTMIQTGGAYGITPNMTPLPQVPGGQAPQERTYGIDNPVTTGQINDINMMTQRSMSEPRVIDMGMGNRMITGLTPSPLTEDKNWNEWRDTESANINMRGNLLRLSELISMAPDDPRSPAGVEWFSEQGARMRTVWTNILDAWRAGSSTGALDEGTLRVFNRMLGNPGEVDMMTAFRNLSGGAKDILANIDEMILEVENNRMRRARSLLSNQDYRKWLEFNNKEERAATIDDVNQYVNARIGAVRKPKIEDAINKEIEKLMGTGGETPTQPSTPDTPATVSTNIVEDLQTSPYPGRRTVGNLLSERNQNLPSEPMGAPGVVLEGFDITPDMITPEMRESMQVRPEEDETDVITNRSIFDIGGS